MKYASFKDVPAEVWRWPSFSPREVACKGTGELLINADALDKLQALRDRLGRPIILTSAYRSAKHNKAVGGAKNSYHMQGAAFDVRMENHSPERFEEEARAVGFTGFGYYPKSGFMHIDTGPERSWGKRWQATATDVAPEVVTQPERMRDDKKAQAAVAAGASGSFALSVKDIPAFGSFLGELAPTAQMIAIGIAALAILYLILARR